MFTAILRKFKQEIRNLRLKLLTAFSRSEEKILYEVPFTSQFADPEYAERTLEGGYPKTSDPDWKNTGAETVDEYATWVTTICGMACSVMALHFFGRGDFKTIELAKDAKTNFVYREDNGELSAMKYEEYARWIAKYGIAATVYTRLSLSGIRFLLSKGSLVIASVNPDIRKYETGSDTQKGGHLVLVVGYNAKDDTITIHNPSGFVSNKSHEYHELPVLQFLRYYAGRGIAVFAL